MTSPPRCPMRCAAGSPMTIAVPRGVVSPQYSLTDAEALARKANKLGELSLKVTGGRRPRSRSTPTMLAGWIDAVATPEALLLGVNGERAAADLDKMFPGVGKPVVADEVRHQCRRQRRRTRRAATAPSAAIPMPGREPLFTAAIRKPPARPMIAAAQGQSNPAITAAEVDAFGIKEVVGTFTTKHPCCAAAGHQHPPHLGPRPRHGDPAAQPPVDQRPRRPAHHSPRVSSSTT